MHLTSPGGTTSILAATAVEVYGPSCEAIRTGDIHALTITYYCMGSSEELDVRAAMADDAQARP